MTAYTPTTGSLDSMRQIIALLERLRPRIPFADEELSHHQQLSQVITEQRARGAEALAAWRSALARRWASEVAAQRLYAALRAELTSYVGSDTHYLQLLDADSTAGALTAADLLTSLRRMAASLALLSPPPPFAEVALADLQAAAAELSAAIEESERWEAERRATQTEQRVVIDLCHRAYQRTHRRIAAHLGSDVDLVG